MSEHACTDDNDDELHHVADALEGIRSALRDLGNGNAATSMGAIEAHGKFVSEAIREAGERIAEALLAIAAALEAKA